jgi:PKD repeat protein
MLDNMEIWINPLANPDGTFYGGSHTINGRRRSNYYNFDLNRNYYDWRILSHLESPCQKETYAFVDLQAAENFVLGVNIHGGAEVCNYPWDNTYTRHADDNWWQLVCYEYADTAKFYSPGTQYMRHSDFGGTGVTNGADWYVVYSGRQDYANYYNHNREFCLEISNTKTPSASLLPNFWNYNYRSFLNFTEQALYGIHGIVTDACSGEPIHAKISVPHDNNNSFVMTDPRVGFYARPIKGGTYSVTYSAEGYMPQIVSVTISDKQRVVKNISLIPTGTSPLPPDADFTADKTIFEEDEEAIALFKDLSTNCPNSWLWYFEGGTPETSTEQNPVISYGSKKNNKSQSFDVKLIVSNTFGSDTILKENFITIITERPFANFEADKTGIEEGDFVHFTDLSINAITWEWYFEGGTPETSTEQNPIVFYENQGAFDVKLTVTNDEGTDMMLKENYIIVNKIAVNEIDGLKVKIFPNPVLRETTITVEADLLLDKIEIINLLGAVIKTEYPHTASHSFSISGIEQGFYLMKIETQKGIFVTKIQIL